MKIFFLVFVSLIVFCQMVLAQKTAPKGFNIYLLPASIKPTQLARINLKKLKPFGNPVIAEDEIQYYQKETHELRVEFEAAERLKKINKVGTKPFAVFVGDEAIYVGSFWKSKLSLSFSGIVIDLFKPLGNPPYYSNTDYPVLILEIGYPSPDFFQGADLRGDKRIFDALEKNGKLYEEVEVTVKCTKILPTRKRRASHIFTLPVTAVTKGSFEEKVIEIELYGMKLQAEFDAEWKDGEMNFKRDQEVVLKISKQVGKQKPDWFLRDYRKK